jgi:AcrR family transcriptional regulator
VMGQPAATERRSRLRERARRDILESAVEVFARRGYAAATLAELAEAAGYAPASLYRYFQSKEEIFRSLVDLVAEEIAGTFDGPADRTRPLADRLRELFEAQQRLGDRHRHVLDLLLTGGGPGPESRSPPRTCTVLEDRSSLDFYATLMEAWLRRNAARRELRQPPDVAARAITGLVFAFRPTGPEDDDVPASRIRLLIDLILHGVAA